LTVCFCATGSAEFLANFKFIVVSYLRTPAAHLQIYAEAVKVKFPGRTWGFYT
jgi:hypothetical protein